jgi:hypothetical protein
MRVIDDDTLLCAPTGGSSAQANCALERAESLAWIWIAQPAKHSLSVHIALRLSKCPEAKPPRAHPDDSLNGEQY